MKYLILLFLLFPQRIPAQATDSSSFRSDSVTVIMLQDSTTLIGYVTNENDSSLIFAIYYYGPKMIEKGKILSRENKLKSDIDLSASSVVQERKNSKSPSLFSTIIIAAANPVGLASAEQLPASKHVPAIKLLKRAHRIWINSVNDSSIVVPRKSLLFTTTANNVVIIDAKDTARTLINVPVTAINTIATRRYHSMAAWFFFWSDLGSFGWLGAFIAAPVMLVVSVAGTLKEDYRIEGNPERYDKIRTSLNKRAIVK